MASRAHWSFFVLVAACFTIFVSYSIRLTYPLVLPRVEESLGLTMTQASLIYSAYFVAYTIFSPVVGILTDRVGARKIISLFCVALGLGTLLMSSITSLLTGLIFFAIVGVGASACYSPIAALVSQWFDEKTRATALGMLVASSCLGMGTIGLILPHWVINYGWRFSWVILGFMAFPLILMNGLILKNKPKNSALNPPETRLSSDQREKFRNSTEINYKRIIKTGKFWLIGFSYLASAIALSVFFVFLTTYATLQLKIDYTTAGAFMTANLYAGIFGGLFFPTVSNYIGRRNVLMLCNGVIAFTLLGFVLITPNIFCLMLLSITNGLATYGAIALYATCAPHYFSPEIVGTVIGLWTVFYSIGEFIAPPVATYLAETTNTFLWSFLFGAMLALAALVLLIPFTFARKSAGLCITLWKTRILD